MAHTFSRLRALALCMTALLGAACLLTSCEETTEQWDPYENWQVRNIAWFASVADSARTAISQAKAQYGDEWEKVHAQVGELDALIDQFNTASGVLNQL